MTHYQLFLFDKIKDELIFHVQNDKVSIYKSKRKIRFNNDEAFFYLIKCKNNCTVFEEYTINHLYDRKDNFIHLESFQPNSKTDNNSMILLWVKNFQPINFLNNTQVWKAKDRQIRGQIVEIDLEGSDLDDYPAYFNDSNQIYYGEYFTKITVEELLDIEV